MSKLKNYNSIEDLCPISSPYQILFLQNSKFNGHFTAVWINYELNYIYYFDIYQ